jgi:uncharacterized membrane protein
MPKKINKPSQPSLQKDQLDKSKTKADRLSIFINNIFGSLIFLFLFLVVMVIWILLNKGLFNMPVFDEYPFPMLELSVSVFAVVLTIAVLISQNRQRKIEKLREELEFEVNLKAEREITKILRMLHDIQEKLGISTHDVELEEMKKDINLDDLHSKIEDNA